MGGRLLEKQERTGEALERNKKCRVNIWFPYPDIMICFGMGPRHWHLHRHDLDNSSMTSSEKGKIRSKFMIHSFCFPWGAMGLGRLVGWPYSFEDPLKPEYPTS